MGAVLVLDTGPDFSVPAARRLLGERVRAIPRLRQRLLAAPPGCGTPFWADDPGYALQRSDLDVLVINDITDARTLAHLLEFDSTYGRLYRVVDHTASAITIDGREIPVLAERDPGNIDWAKYGVDVVVEATGKFRARDQAALVGARLG